MRSSKLYRATGGSLSRAGPSDLALRLHQCSISTAALRHPSDASTLGSSGFSSVSTRHYGERSFGMGENRSGSYGESSSSSRGKPSYAGRNQERDRPRHFDNSGLDPYGETEYPGRPQRSRSKFDASTGTDSGQREHKKYKKGMFKEAFYNDPADNLPDDAFLISRLRAVLNPPSSSYEPAQPDPYQVLDACTPLLGPKLQYIMDKNVHDIARILSDHFSTKREKVDLPSVQKAVGDVISMCFVRAASNQFQTNRRSFHDPKDRTRTDTVAESYARYLLHQAVTSPADTGRLSALLETLERALRLYQVNGMGYRITVPLVAAWIVLRGKLGKTDSPAYRFIWPSPDSVTKYLEEYMSKSGGSAEEFASGLQLLSQNSLPDLPATPEELHDKVIHLVNSGSEDGLIDLWRQFRDYLGTASPMQPPPGTLFDEQVRPKVLATILRALKSSRFGEDPPRNVEALDRASDEVLSIVSRPFPREMLHTLVANRARVVGPALEMESGADVFALDRYLESDPQPTKKDTALRNLHEAWGYATEPGAVRDIKLYMLYLEGLGRLGDLHALQAVWNEMVRDKECAELYMKEEKVTADDGQAYPPTIILNQMLSAAMFIPRTGPPAALELFHQATSPQSSIKVNIITINTMLRHYARLGDIDGLQSLFGLADQRGLSPDIVTYTTLLQGLLRAGKLDMAMTTLASMHESGLEPNERMCTVLIADLAKGGTKIGLQHAEQLMREMRRRDFKVGQITWTALIAGYFKGGWEADGWNAVQRMEDANLSLNRVSYNVLLRAAGDTVEMDSNGPTTMRIFQKMVQDGVRPNSATYSIVLAPLMKARWWSEADKVVAIMEDLRFAPEKNSLREMLKKIKFRRPLDWETPKQRQKRLAAEGASW